MNITLRQMRAFSGVARTGSFTGTARQLHLTQSAVSMLVQQLEDELGIRLFDRSRQSVTLTEAGQQLLPVARRMLDDLQVLEDGVSDLRTLRSGVLRVVAPQLLACTWLAAVLVQFENAFPNVGLRIMDGTSDDIVAAVRRGDAEIGLGPERATGEDVTRTFLMHVPMRLACAANHRLAQRKTIAWRELQGERWVAYSGDFNRFVEQLLHDHGVSLSMQTVTEVDYLTTALALVGNGLGVAAVPDYARHFASSFNLSLVPLKAPAIHREFFVYQRRGQTQSPAASAFTQLMKRVAAG